MFQYKIAWHMSIYLARIFTANDVFFEFSSWVLFNQKSLEIRPVQKFSKQMLNLTQRTVISLCVFGSEKFNLVWNRHQPTTKFPLLFLSTHSIFMLWWRKLQRESREKKTEGKAEVEFFKQLFVCILQHAKKCFCAELGETTLKFKLLLFCIVYSNQRREFSIESDENLTF